MNKTAVATPLCDHIRCRQLGQDAVCAQTPAAPPVVKNYNFAGLQKTATIISLCVMGCVMVFTGHESTGQGFFSAAVAAAIFL